MDDDYDSPDRVAISVQRPKPAVIEVCSPHSAAGKTSLLYLITAYTLLPTFYGGKASAAVWVDSDGRFSVTRLSQVMQHVVSKADTKESSESVVHSALNNLYVLTPNSSTQLLTNLQGLPNNLLNIHSKLPLSLFILDSATAFTAQDRFDADITRLEACPDFSSRPQTPTRTTQIISSLRTIQHLFNCTIIFSTNSTPPHTPSTPAPHPPQAAQRSTNRPLPNPNAPQPPPPLQPLPTPASGPFTAFALLTLHLSRTQITPFPPGASLTECLHDREKRQAAVLAGRISVGVDWSGSDRWPPGVREAVGRLEGRGRAEMRVTGVGVEMV